MSTYIWQRDARTGKQVRVKSATDALPTPIRHGDASTSTAPKRARAAVVPPEANPAVANDPPRITTTTETPNLENDGRGWVVLWQHAETGEFDGLQWHCTLNPHSVLNLLVDALLKTRIVENEGLVGLYKTIGEQGAEIDRLHAMIDGTAPIAPPKRRKGVTR